MVTERYFSTLSNEEKYQVVWSMAVYLCVNKAANCPSFLYQVNDFYVEVVYNETLSKIITIRSFTNPQELAPYLRKIDLQEIYQAI